MYPAYKAAEAMHLYALTFFSLLNEGYRVRYGAAILAAQIADLPQMSKEDRQEFYNKLEYAAMHPSDILRTDGAGSSDTDIKKVLGG